MTGCRMVSGMANVSTKQRLATHLLGRPVLDWLWDRYVAGRSYRELSTDLASATGGQVLVSYQTIANWIAPIRRRNKS